MANPISGPSGKLSRTIFFLKKGNPHSSNLLTLGLMIRFKFILIGSALTGGLVGGKDK